MMKTKNILSIFIALALFSFSILAVVASEIEDELKSLIKPLRQAKIETIKYYRENPESFSVVTGTDLIKDFLNDIKTLLEK